jgi:hypothetical protein
MLADACGRYALVVRFLAYTGLRWGEVCQRCGCRGWILCDAG